MPSFLMSQIPIEQAILQRQPNGLFRLLARSAGFLDDGLPEVERLAAAFGEKPAGATFPGCFFAQPFGRRHAAVVQVAELNRDLGFHFLILPLTAYKRWMGDPFLVAERLPAPWHTERELPVLFWPLEPLSQRTVAQVQKVLQRPEGPTLLGGAQVLVDGGRLVFERPGPDLDLMRDLWTLLPHSTRAGLWPATFAFGNSLHFDALIVPRAPAEEFAEYVHEEQAANYPHGRYELNLQIAAEAGDQAELDSLFARRSRAQTWRLGLMLLTAVIMLALASKLLQPAAQNKKERPSNPPPAKQNP